MELIQQYESDGKIVRGNPQLKGPDAKEYLPEDDYQKRIQEIIKCKNDIVYFANNYFKIISPGKGLHQIKLYPRQEEMLRHMVDEDRAIVLAARQIGKCQSWLTLIKIKHKSLNIKLVMPIGMLYFLVKVKKIIDICICRSVSIFR